MQVHTIALSDQDSLIAYVEDAIAPAIASTLKGIGPAAALIGVVADRMAVDAICPGANWQDAGEFLVAVVDQDDDIAPIYNRLVDTMLRNPAESIRTVFGLTVKRESCNGNGHAIHRR